MTRVTVLLADDHVFLCEMLAARLEQAGLNVVTKVNNASDALAAARRLHPRIAVLDIDMPGMSAFDVARQLRAEGSCIRVVLLSAHVTDHFVDQALDIEVAGYLSKTESLESIVRAIQSISEGRVYFSAEVRARITVTGGAAVTGAARTRGAILTPREVEVLGYIARGHSKKEIAELIHRSAKTVDHHCTNLMAKLEIHDRVQLARYAVREGITAP